MWEDGGGRVGVGVGGRRVRGWLPTCMYAGAVPCCESAIEAEAYASRLNIHIVQVFVAALLRELNVYTGLRCHGF